jgi:hypothetical protein
MSLYAILDRTQILYEQFLMDPTDMHFDDE